MDKQNENNCRKLFIIGNGFDLNHNLPTKYQHFKEYLSDEIRESETLGLSDGTLWEAQTAHRFRRFCPLRLCGVT